MKIFEVGQENDWALETSCSSFDCDLPRRYSVAFVKLRAWMPKLIILAVVKTVL